MNIEIKNKEEALKAIAELRQFIEKEDSNEKWKPKLGEHFNVILNERNIGGTHWDECPSDIVCYEYGNCFRAVELAEAEVMRKKSRAQAWIPKEYDYFYYSNSNGSCLHTDFSGAASDFLLAYEGMCKKTSAETQEWYDTFGKYYFDINLLKRG